MKKLMPKVVFSLLFLLALQPLAPIEISSSDPIIIVTSIDGTLTLTVAMHKNNSGGALVSSMDFGVLEDIGTHTLRSSSTGTTGTGAVAVFITTNSHGAPYSVTQTGTALSNGAVTLPAGACAVTPVYSTFDNGGAALPSGASLGTPGTWVATNKILYQSDSAGALRTFQAYYSITDDPSAGASSFVPMDQAGGTYTGTVTITATST